jgi:lysophospholipase L1-like esterase
MNSPPALRTLAAVAVGVTALALTGCAAQRLSTARALAQASEPYQQQPAAPTARLLIVGDSTGVGTGAGHSAGSVAGRLGAEHPGWVIDNRAADGARFAGVVAQLEAARAQGTRYDVVLVMAGGNDVIRLTRQAELEAQIDRTALVAQDLAPKVIFLPCGNVGNAPFFWPPLSWWMSDRSRLLHRLVQDAAQQSGASYVNLYQDRQQDPFVRDADRLNAADGLHPSAEGYAVWRNELRRQAGL